MALTACNTFKDDTFPPTHSGIRFSKDMSTLDVMDCFMFVAASYGAARVLKTNYMSKIPLVRVVWEGSIPKRKRDTCTTSSMLKVLGLCTKPEAAMLSSKISNLTAIVVTNEQIREHAENTILSSAIEEIDTSTRISVDSTPESRASIVVPYFTAGVVNGMYNHHMYAFGNQEKAKEFMQATLTTANQIYDANSSKLMQTEKCAEAEACEEHAYRKRMRDVNETNEKNTIKMDSLEKQIKFYKSVGYEKRADRLMKVYNTYAPPPNTNCSA